DVNVIYKKVTEKVYKTEVEKAIKNGRLEQDEKEFLEKLKSNLKLSDNVASKIYKEGAEKLIRKFINNAISDERLSPDEEKELNAIAESLNIDLKLDYPTRAVLDKYKLLWKIENEEIPAIDVDIKLQKKEKCYFYTRVNWYEQRKITKRIKYSGPTLRIKIAKGLYWRTGNLGFQTISENQWRKLDSGDLFLTNKRLIFLGNNGNKTIKLNKIIDFESFSNGVEIKKETGRNPFLEFDKNIDIFSIILGRAISDI
ncbi:hypothetical protein DRQ09_04965, partial [candidate division KSB1 bacterium]